MDKKIVAFLSLFCLLSGVSFASAGCNLVSGKAYYSDGVSLFKDAACHQEMSAAELNADTPAVISLGSGGGNCRLVSGKAYYSDGVGLFKDSACRQEMTDVDSSTATAAPTTVITGGGNCRYNASRQQFTDGTAFFTDNKCSQEALDGQTVPNVSASLASAVTAVGAGDAQFTQLSQRIDVLEKRMVSLQSLLVQLLALLAKR